RIRPRGRQLKRQHTPSAGRLPNPYTPTMLRRATNAFSTWVDDLVLTAVVVGEVRRGFSRTRPLDPPRFEELLEELRAAPPALSWPGERARGRVAVSLPALGEASFLDLFP